MENQDKTEDVQTTLSTLSKMLTVGSLMVGLPCSYAVIKISGSVVELLKGMNLTLEGLSKLAVSGWFPYLLPLLVALALGLQFNLKGSPLRSLQAQATVFLSIVLGFYLSMIVLLTPLEQLLDVLR